MNWLCGLLGAGLLLLPLSADAQSTTKAQKTLHPAKTASTAGSNHSTTTARADKGGGATVATKNAGNLKRVSTGSAARLRSRKGSKTRLKKAAAPSYQLHPDPERYQQIQQSLAERGFFKGQPDGTWNDDSVQAVRDFQSANQLDSDGKINALTLMKLGLGPKHDGSGAPLTGTGAGVGANAEALHTAAPPEVPSPTSDVQVPPQPTTLPPETETTPQ